MPSIIVAEINTLSTATCSTTTLMRLGHYSSGFSLIENKKENLELEIPNFAKTTNLSQKVLLCH